MTELLHLYVSPGHNYFGHHGKPPGSHLVVELPEIQCLAGRGIVGDRFLDHAENYKGQITFFAYEVYEALCRELGLHDKTPGVFRRNVITRGCELDQWIGAEFEIQGMRFRGIESCKPCYWMDHACAPGSEKALQGRGGLRAAILTDGVLRVNRLAPLSKVVEQKQTIETKNQAL